MYAREWRCLCPEKNREGFLDYLYQTGVREIKASSGYMGFQIMDRDCRSDEAGGRKGMVEIVLITYWKSLEAVAVFAGDDIGVAKLYPEDEKYGIVPDETVRHYKVRERSLA